MGLLFDFLGLLGVGYFKSSLVIFVEAVILEGMHGNGGLEGVFEINETEEKLPAGRSGLLDEPDALETGEGAEDI